MTWVPKCVVAGPSKTNEMFEFVTENGIWSPPVMQICSVEVGGSLSKGAFGSIACDETDPIVDLKTRQSGGAHGRTALHVPGDLTWLAFRHRVTVMAEPRIHSLAVLSHGPVR